MVAAAPISCLELRRRDPVLWRTRTSQRSIARCRRPITWSRRFINAYFALRGTNYVTNISPMHAPFHLYEFTLGSFEKNGARLGYAIAHHRYDVCAVMNLPRVIHPLLKWWMGRTDTGMQLTVYLRKG